MNNYDKYKFLKEELKAPRFENEDEEIEWFTTQLYGLYKQSYRLREENKRLNKSLEELSQYKYDREEEDMMNYLIEQEEVFNDYSFMEE